MFQRETARGIYEVTIEGVPGSVHLTAQVLNDPNAEEIAMTMLCRNAWRYAHVPA